MDVCILYYLSPLGPQPAWAGRPRDAEALLLRSLRLRPQVVGVPAPRVADEPESTVGLSDRGQ